MLLKTELIYELRIAAQVVMLRHQFFVARLFVPFYWANLKF